MQAHRKDIKKEADLYLYHRYLIVSSSLRGRFDLMKKAETRFAHLRFSFFYFRACSEFGLSDENKGFFI